jgi:hypothetical protein
MGLALLISQLLGNLGLALLLPLTGPTPGLPAIILLQTVSALLLPGCSTARQAQPARHWTGLAAGRQSAAQPARQLDDPRSRQPGQQHAKPVARSLAQPVAGCICLFANPPGT